MRRVAKQAPSLHPFAQAMTVSAELPVAVFTHVFSPTCVPSFFATHLLDPAVVSSTKHVSFFVSGSAGALIVTYPYVAGYDPPSESIHAFGGIGVGQAPVVGQQVVPPQPFETHRAVCPHALLQTSAIGRHVSSHLLTVSTQFRQYLVPLVFPVQFAFPPLQLALPELAVPQASTLHRTHSVVHAALTVFVCVIKRKERTPITNSSIHFL